jgi:hypothetical protein
VKDRGAWLWRKHSVAAGVLCSVVLVLDLGLAGATFSGTTDNTSNSVSALVVEPPTAFDGTVSLNVLPLATCRADLTWTPSVTPGVTGYELRRVTAATGAVVDGPYSLSPATTAYTDSPFPLQLIADAYAWEIRTVHDTWTSTWVRVSPPTLLLCLI